MLGPCRWSTASDRPCTTSAPSWAWPPRGGERLPQARTVAGAAPYGAGASPPPRLGRGAAAGLRLRTTMRVYRVLYGGGGGGEGGGRPSLLLDGGPACFLTLLVDGKMATTLDLVADIDVLDDDASDGRIARAA